MKRIIPPFGHHAITLRLIEERDLETTLAWRNRNDARIWFKSSQLITLEQHHAWFTHYLVRDNDFLFVVETAKDLIGQVSVYQIDWQQKHAEIGRILAAPNASGKGLMTKACGELIHLCRDNFKLDYLYLEVFTGNDRAIRLYQRNGFVAEQRDKNLIRMSRVLSDLPHNISSDARQIE